VTLFEDLSLFYLAFKAQLVLEGAPAIPASSITDEKTLFNEIVDFCANNTIETSIGRMTPVVSMERTVDLGGVFRQASYLYWKVFKSIHSVHGPLLRQLSNGLYTVPPFEHIQNDDYAKRVLKASGLFLLTCIVHDGDLPSYFDPEIIRYFLDGNGNDSLEDSLLPDFARDILYDLANGFDTDKLSFWAAEKNISVRVLYLTCR
jgi:hypothetical protein